MRPMTLFSFSKSVKSGLPPKPLTLFDVLSRSGADIETTQMVARSLILEHQWQCPWVYRDAAIGIGREWVFLLFHKADSFSYVNKL